MVARAPDPGSARDDTLILMFMCCHPSLTPASAIPLTLRAVGGLTTREIAAAFLVPEATMAQRISRAKAKVKASDEPFALPSPDERAERLRSVLHVLYLLFNEGYASSSGPDLARTDLSGEAIRLARACTRPCPTTPRSPACSRSCCSPTPATPRHERRRRAVPLAEQDRTLWDRALIAEGVALVTEALRRGQDGRIPVQAAIAAVHDQAARHADTEWSEILALYSLLERMTGNPMVTLNRAVAAAMADGPDAGLALLDGLDERLGDHHRLHSVRAHLLELAGDTVAAIPVAQVQPHTTNLHEPHYLTDASRRLTTDLAAN